jgi:hypothetical protein
MASSRIRNVLALGEVLLGYANEYGKYTNRPLLDLGGPDEPVAAAWTILARRISLATAPTSYCGSRRKTCAVSGVSSTSKRNRTPHSVSDWPSAWWAARWTVIR